MSIITILGPTCTGKTSLADKLATKYNGEIVSADSRQVYKHMDIGTGKVPRSTKIRTWLQDVVEPNENYSVADWVKEAQYVVSNIYSRGKIPFIVGGTGFYIDVLLGFKQLAWVPANYKLRSELEKLSMEELVNKLRKVNRELAERTDLNNRRRVIRALELSYTSSDPAKPESQEATLNKRLSTRVYSEFAKGTNSKHLVIGLKSENEFLYQRADTWVEEILKNNALLEETAKLVEMGYKNTVPLQSFIYRTVLDYFDHQLDYEGMKQEIKFNMHAYIRRQLTWFKKSPPNIEWYNISDPKYMQKVESSVECKYRA